MKLLSLTDADLRHLTSRQDRLREICDLKGRNLGNKRLTALGFRQCLNNKLHAFIQADPETCHPIIGNRKRLLPVLYQITEERNNRSAASCNIAVTHDGKADIFGSRICIRGNKELVRYKLCTAIEVDRIYRLICGQGNHALYAAV